MKYVIIYTLTKFDKIMQEVFLFYKETRKGYSASYCNKLFAYYLNLVNQNIPFGFLNL